MSALSLLLRCSLPRHALQGTSASSQSPQPVPLILLVPRQVGCFAATNSVVEVCGWVERDIKKGVQRQAVGEARHGHMRRGQTVRIVLLFASAVCCQSFMLPLRQAITGIVESATRAAAAGSASAACMSSLASEPMRVGIVGAGVSGCTLARKLKDAGVDVTVFEMGRGAGGRMATRKTRDFPVSANQVVALGGQLRSHSRDVACRDLQSITARPCLSRNTRRS